MQLSNQTILCLVDDKMGKRMTDVNPNCTLVFTYMLEYAYCTLRYQHSKCTYAQYAQLVEELTFLCILFCSTVGKEIDETGQKQQQTNRDCNNNRHPH